MREIYHGTTKQNLDVIKPFKRYTPGDASAADSIPPRIYATYKPTFAVAHSFPWSSEDGIDTVIENEVVTILVPNDKKSVLEQEICIYSLSDHTFELTKEEETGLTYHSTEEIIPLKNQCFDSIQTAMEYFGGVIKLI